MKQLAIIERCCAPLESAVSEAEATELEKVFRALADRHRIKIVGMLSQAGGAAICVCEFVPVLGLAQPTVSYHLKQLTNAGLVVREKRGVFAYYRLAPSALTLVRDLIDNPAGLAAAG